MPYYKYGYNIRFVSCDDVFSEHYSVKIIMRGRGFAHGVQVISLACYISLGKTIIKISHYNYYYAPRLDIYMCGLHNT